MPSFTALRDFLATRARLPLGLFPTPLVRLERLGARLGIDLWMKRDDCSGVALGGNKARKLEYILAAARARGHDTIVTVGPLTSNHTMMTAAACRRAGFAIHCVVGGRRPAAPSGNLLLLDYLGATLHFTAIDYTDPTPESTDALRNLCAEVSRTTGGFWVPAGGSMPEAEPGYMNAVLEIADQRGGGFDFEHVVLAIGTGSTTAGLLLGLALAGVDAKVWAVPVMSRRALEEVIRLRPSATQFADSAARLGLGLAPDRPPPHEWVFGFAEEGYGVPTQAGDAAIRAMAREEGYLLDPVYTAKAFAGLTTLATEGRIRRGSRVLFLHTGGLSMTPAGEKSYRNESNESND